ncbi:MAG: DUF2442 domain-containing protein [Arenicellales bacterium]
MTILAVEMTPLAQDVSFSDDVLIVDLIDGRTLSAPLIWFPKLSNASQKQRETWEIMGSGEGIHWPEIDEDLSIAGLLIGAH